MVFISLATPCTRFFAKVLLCVSQELIVSGSGWAEANVMIGFVFFYCQCVIVFSSRDLLD